MNCIRNYDGSLDIFCEPQLQEDLVDPSELIDAFNVFRGAVRRMESATPEQEEALQKKRTEILNVSDRQLESLRGVEGLRNNQGIELLTKLRGEINAKSQPEFAQPIEGLLNKIDEMIARCKAETLANRLRNSVEKVLPIFIYFENYGILDSAVYLPRLLDEIRTNPTRAQIRTINAMFKHVGLTADEIQNLGNEQTKIAKQQNHPITEQMIAQDQQNKELREIKL